MQEVGISWCDSTIHYKANGKLVDVGTFCAGAVCSGEAAVASFRLAEGALHLSTYKCMVFYLMAT